MASRAAARRLAREDGFTLVELLVAMAVTAVGLMALVSSFDHSRDLVTLAEKTEVASHQAERKVEAILALAYSDVAHASAPADSADPDSPASFVNGGSYQWDQGSTGPQSNAMVVDAAGDVPSAPEAWTDSESRLEGEVHSFVTWQSAACQTATCPKRVTVAVTVGGPRPLRKPVLISTVLVDPDDTGT
jgi:prepilin-type N-terminal cleavage/methylation domain-containing protein